MSSLEQLFESLRNFDYEQLNDLDNVGSWPLAIKFIVWILIFAAAIIGFVFPPPHTVPVFLVVDIRSTDMSEPALSGLFEVVFSEIRITELST